MKQRFVLAVRVGGDLYLNTVYAFKQRRTLELSRYGESKQKGRIPLGEQTKRRSKMILSTSNRPKSRAHHNFDGGGHSRHSRKNDSG